MVLKLGVGSVAHERKSSSREGELIYWQRLSPGWRDGLNDSAFARELGARI